MSEIVPNLDRTQRRKAFRVLMVMTIDALVLIMGIGGLYMWAVAMGYAH